VDNAAKPNHGAKTPCRSLLHAKMNLTLRPVKIMIKYAEFFCNSLKDWAQIHQIGSSGLIKPGFLLEISLIEPSFWLANGAAGFTPNGCGLVNPV
jgi:hypothetical protein